MKMVENKLKELIGITIIVKLLFFLIIILAYFVLPFNIENYHTNFVYPSNEQANIFSVFKTWDGQHYLYLAEKGYPDGVTLSTAFYPLFPFIIRFVGVIFLGNTLLAGLIIANLCSILAIVYFYLLVKKLYNDKIAFTASLFMISFITFFYTSFVYSESLFLLLVIAFFYYFYEKQFYPCFLLSILIPLVRPSGILVILPLLGYVILGLWYDKKVKETESYLLLIGFVLGFLLYLCIMKYFTGSFFSGFDAQNLYIANNSLGNLFHPISWFQRNFINIHYTFNGYTTSILNRIFFGFYLLLLFFLYKYLDKTLFVYSLALGLIPALTGDFMSYIRYLFVVFPIFIVLSLKFQKNAYFIIIPSFMLQILLLILHALNYWVA
jgi:Gpi18-like mannosyltransferase